MPKTFLSLAPLRHDRASLQFAVAFEVTLLSRRLRARFAERAKSHGQTDARWSALYMLHVAPEGLIQSELAERMGIQGPTLVRMLDKLEADGLVSRRAVSTDRRAKKIFLEPAGEAMLREIDVVADRLRNEAFAGATDAELETTLRLLLAASRRMQPEKDLLANESAEAAPILP